MPQQIIKKEKYQYDVFLSHASEDKDDVARPLAILLQDRGLRVWYDEFELRIGDNLVSKLNAGTNESRFGIIILSYSFFEKRWTNHELNMLELLWVTEDRMLFPVWHNIGEEEIRAYRASLANIIGRRTEALAIEDIAAEIHEVILAFYAEEQVTGSDEA